MSKHPSGVSSHAITAFNKCAQAVEAVWILCLSVLIWAAQGIVNGLERAKAGLEESTTWMIPGRAQQDQ